MIETRANGMKARALAGTVALLVACGGEDATGPGPGATPQGPGAPAAPQIYDLELAVGYDRRLIFVAESCDDDDILGNRNPGEFQVQLVMEGPGGHRETFATDGYGDVLGANIQAHAGTSIEGPVMSHRWTAVDTTEGFRAWLRVTEWDGLSRDSRMNDRADTVVAGFSGAGPGPGQRQLSLGSSTNHCAVRADVRWNYIAR
jgi:hypothetical protein